MSSSPSNKEVVAHVCKVLELDDDVPSFLENHCIQSFRRLTTTTVDQHERLCNIAGSPLHHADINQINLFRTWYTQKIQAKGLLNNEAIITEITSEAWDDFCGGYLIYI